MIVGDSFLYPGRGHELASRSVDRSDFSLLEAIESGLVRSRSFQCRSDGTKTPAYSYLAWFRQAEKVGFGMRLAPAGYCPYAAQPIMLLAQSGERPRRSGGIQAAHADECPPVSLTLPEYRAGEDSV